MDIFVLDACAYVAFLRKEQGFEKVVLLIEKADNKATTIIIHTATIAEVYYDFLRASGKLRADNVLADTYKLPLKILSETTPELIQYIGYFKTHYKISFADCFVLATAKIHNATVVTSDHHEFDAVEKNGDVSFEWIR